MPMPAIEDYEIALSAGEGLILYTDGVTEAVNEAKTFFGEERLAKVLEGRSGAEEATGSIAQAVMEFSRGCEPFDDLTVLSLFYDVKRSQNRPRVTSATAEPSPPPCK